MFSDCEMAAGDMTARSTPKSASPPPPAGENSALIVVEWHGELSETLQRRYGRGFSVANLKQLRLFFQAYANRSPEICHKACDKLGAAFLCADLGITPKVRADHAVYLVHWLEVLKAVNRID